MKFYIERLGCPKNDVDADYMAGRLISEGHEQVLDSDLAEAVIVNTCGFLESMMRQVIRKQEGRATIVTHGLTIRCFVMRFLAEGVSEGD